MRRIIAKPSTQIDLGQNGTARTSVQIKCTREWREWLKRAEKATRLDMAKLIDISLAQQVKSMGFHEEPPIRI
jgi:hypothetical protein